MSLKLMREILYCWHVRIKSIIFIKKKFEFLRSFYKKINRMREGMALFFEIYLAISKTVLIKLRLTKHTVGVTCIYYINIYYFIF